MGISGFRVILVLNYSIVLPYGFWGESPSTASNLHRCASAMSRLRAGLDSLDPRHLDRRILHECSARVTEMAREGSGNVDRAHPPAAE
jgi:hypothetical protein